MLSFFFLKIGIFPLQRNKIDTFLLAPPEKFSIIFFRSLTERTKKARQKTKNPYTAIPLYRFPCQLEAGG
jgi:hypothetical protein